MKPPYTPPPNRSIDVDWGATELVTDHGEPLVVVSPHHDVIAHMRYDRNRMGDFREVLRQLGMYGPEVQEGEIVEHKVHLAESGWQWAEFVRDPNSTKGYVHHDLYATDEARPCASTAPPNRMEGGVAYLYRIALGRSSVPTFNEVAIRRDRAEHTTVMREQSQKAEGGRMIPRRA